MTNTSPTPRPWKYIETPLGNHVIGSDVTMETICHANTANAAHIVRCVNSHDALLQAAKAAYDHYSATIDTDMSNELHDTRHEILNKLRDAIAQAEGTE